MLQMQKPMRGITALSEKFNNSSFFKCQAGVLRLAKVNPNNPFGSGPMRQWFHIDCFFNLKKTKTSKIITTSSEIKGWEMLTSEEKNDLLKKLGPDFKIDAIQFQRSLSSSKVSSKDNLFSEFQNVVNKIANEPSYNSKSQILHRYLRDVRSEMLKTSSYSLTQLFYRAQVNTLRVT